MGPQSFVTFSDLAGHAKYLKITASGLASQFPDYAMLVVDATAGVQPMTREHVKIATALEVALCVVLTKSDAGTVERIQQTIAEVATLLRECGSVNELTLVERSSDHATVESVATTTPLLLVSNVTGDGLDVLQAFIARLQPTRMWASKDSTAVEFQINNAYDIEDTGTIVTGLVQSGSLCIGERMLLGPDAVGAFVGVTIDSIEVQRKAVSSLRAGETGAVLLNFTLAAMSASHIRKGMMLVHPSVQPMATRQFDAEVHFLSDSPTIRANSYQAMIHAGQVRQMAKLVAMSDAVEDVITGPLPSYLKTICRFEFMYWPEYMRPDLPLVLREGSAHGVGKVVRAVHHLATTTEQLASVRTF